MTQLRKQTSISQSAFPFVCTNKPPSRAPPPPRSGNMEAAITRVTLRIINPPFQLLPPDTLPPEKPPAKLADLWAGTFPLQQQPRAPWRSSSTSGVGGAPCGGPGSLRMCALTRRQSLTGAGRWGQWMGAEILSQNHPLLEGKELCRRKLTPQLWKMVSVPFPTAPGSFL